MAKKKTNPKDPKKSSKISIKHEEEKEQIRKEKKQNPKTTTKE
ncbi:MAG: hypothetical protein Q8880_09530 [Bacteroidota bacterium]|nr:hypothetical protein [Bacteroidota bacterium]